MQIFQLFINSTVDIKPTTVGPTDEISCDAENMTLKKGGYHCRDTCINDNTPHNSWSEAWEKCATLESCTRIFRWENGSHYYYHLRKADDEFDDNPRFVHVDFNPKCRCKVETMILKKGGYHCNGDCINNNTEYHDWKSAWKKCGEIDSCSRVFRWENGSHYHYYLRKKDDNHDPNPRYLYVEYDPKCRGTNFKHSAITYFSLKKDIFMFISTKLLILLRIKEATVRSFILRINGIEMFTRGRKM